MGETDSKDKPPSASEMGLNVIGALTGIKNAADALKPSVAGAEEKLSAFSTLMPGLTESLGKGAIKMQAFSQMTGLSMEAVAGLSAGIAAAAVVVTAFVVAAVVGAGAIAAAWSALKPVMLETEQQITRLQSAMQDNVKGVYEFQKAVAFAASTPFPVQEVTSSAAMLRAFQFDPFEKMTGTGRKLMDVLGDMAGAMGTDVATAAHALNRAFVGEWEIMQNNFQISARLIPQLKHLRTGTEGYRRAILKFLDTQTRFTGGMLRVKQTISGMSAKIADASHLIKLGATGVDLSKTFLGNATLYDEVRDSLREVYTTVADTSSYTKMAAAVDMGGERLKKFLATQRDTITSAGDLAKFNKAFKVFKTIQDPIKRTEALLKKGFDMSDILNQGEKLKLTGTVIGQVFRLVWVSVLAPFFKLFAKMWNWVAELGLNALQSLGLNFNAIAQQGTKSTQKFLTSSAALLGVSTEYMSKFYRKYTSENERAANKSLSTIQKTVMFLAVVITVIKQMILDSFDSIYDDISAIFRPMDNIGKSLTKIVTGTTFWGEASRTVYLIYRGLWDTFVILHNVVGAFFDGVISGLADMGVIQDILDIFGEIFGMVGDILVPLLEFTGLLKQHSQESSVFYEIIKLIAKVITGGMLVALKVVLVVIKAIAIFLRSMVQMLMVFVKALLTMDFSGVEKALDKIASETNDKFAKMWEGIKDSLFEVFVAPFIDLWDNITDSIDFDGIGASIVSGFKSFGGAIYDSIIQPFIDMDTAINSWGDRQIEKVITFFTFMGHFAVAIAKDAWASIVSHAESAWSRITTVFLVLKHVFSTLLKWYRDVLIDPMISGFSAAFHTIVAAIIRIWSGLKNVFGHAWDAFSRAFPKIASKLRALWVTLKNSFYNMFILPAIHLWEKFKSIVSLGLIKPHVKPGGGKSGGGKFDTSQKPKQSWFHRAGAFFGLGASAQEEKVKKKYGRKYGGPVDFTGLAYLHGTPGDPEYVLNPKEYRHMKELFGVGGSSSTSGGGGGGAPPGGGIFLKSVKKLLKAFNELGKVVLRVADSLGTASFGCGCPPGAGKGLSTSSAGVSAALSNMRVSGASGTISGGGGGAGGAGGGTSSGGGGAASGGHSGRTPGAATSILRRGPGAGHGTTSGGPSGSGSRAQRNLLTPAIWNSYKSGVPHNVKSGKDTIPLDVNGDARLIYLNSKPYYVPGSAGGAMLINGNPASWLPESLRTAIKNASRHDSSAHWFPGPKRWSLLKKLRKSSKFVPAEYSGTSGGKTTRSSREEIKYWPTQYRTGTPVVPYTGIYRLHQGEQVVPAHLNPANGIAGVGRARGAASMGQGSMGDININVNGPASTLTRQVFNQAAAEFREKIRLGV